jgi:hypothetical protein
LITNYQLSVKKNVVIPIKASFEKKHIKVISYERKELGEAKG